MKSTTNMRGHKDEFHKNARVIIMARVISKGKPMRQSDIFHECELSWGEYEHAEPRRQQYWVVGALQTLAAEGMVRRIGDRGPWTYTAKGQDAYGNVPWPCDGLIQEFKENAIARVKTFMAENLESRFGGHGMTQAEVCNGADLGWGSLPKATATNQQFWGVALLYKLADEGIVRRIDNNGHRTRWTLAR